jgi:putative cardiolipin synthase
MHLPGHRRTSSAPRGGPNRVTAFLTLALVALSACAAPPPAVERTVSFALESPEATTLGRNMVRPAMQHPGMSGFNLIASGREDFEARVALAALAEKTLDLQYFIWNGDETGRLVLASVLAAADRGVRVRILLDDLHLAGKDFNLAVLNAHRNVEVRLFNPFEWRSNRWADFLADFPRLDHRMHDKALIVDNAVAVVGGRNIGDHYFAVDGEANFRDLDLFAVGPVVQEISGTFDAFWNSDWSVPIHALAPERPTARDVQALVAQVDRLPSEGRSFPFKTAVDPRSASAPVERLTAHLIWGKATLLADRPDKPQTSRSGIVDTLRGEIGGTVDRELLLESAYFIPAGSGTEHLCDLVKRGVRVRVLTNSFASNDEFSAYAGYAKYREDLLRCGVELYEMQADPSFVRRYWTWLKTRSVAQLHTKAAVLDRRQVFIGSFNMDPRSARLNTELALLVESPELAARVAAFIDTGMQPDNAYRLELDQAGHLVWLARDHGKLVRFDHEPGIDFWHSLSAAFLSILPIESQL